MLTFVKFGTQNFKGTFAVLHLGAFLGAEHPDACWLVHKIHRGFHLVDVLTAGTSGSGGTDLEILGIDLHFHGSASGITATVAVEV